MQPLCFASQYSVCMIDAAGKLKSCLYHGKVFFPPVQIVPWYMRALPRNCPSHGGTYAPHMGCLGILQLHSSCRVGFLGKHCKGVSILWVGLTSLSFGLSDGLLRTCMYGIMLSELHRHSDLRKTKSAADDAYRSGGLARRSHYQPAAV